MTWVQVVGDTPEAHAVARELAHELATRTRVVEPPPRRKPGRPPLTPEKRNRTLARVALVARRFPGMDDAVVFEICAAEVTTGHGADAIKKLMVSRHDKTGMQQGAPWLLDRCGRAYAPGSRLRKARGQDGGESVPESRAAFLKRIELAPRRRESKVCGHCAACCGSAYRPVPSLLEAAGWSMDEHDNAMKRTAEAYPDEVETARERAKRGGARTRKCG